MQIIHNRFDENKGIILQNGKRLFFKLNDKDAVELIYKKIADNMGINCAQYSIYEFGGKEYYLSPDIGSEGEFATAEALHIRGDRLCTIYDYFEKYYPMDKDRLYNEIVKIYILDMLLLNFDRTELNWGILKKNGNVDLYIFDNECAFSIGSCYISCRKKKLYENININNDIWELEAFIETADQEYKDMLRKMYKQLTPEYIEGIIGEVEKDIGREVRNKDVLLYVYKMHYEELGALIKQPILEL